MSFSSSYLEKRKKRLKEREKQLDNKFNNDIAPVGGNKDSWFKGGALADGYEFGDITKTILGTVGDAGIGIVKGAGRMVEGIADVATYGVAGVADLFGADSFAEDARDVAKFSATDEFTAPVTDYVDKFSLLGNKADSVTEGLGQVGTILLTGGAGGAAGLGTGGVTALTTGVTGLSSMGSGISQAYTEGATDEEALTYGLIAGVAEAGTELLFGGLGKAVGAVGLSKGISSLDDALAKKVSSKIANQTMKNFAEFGIKAGAEGTEEVISGILQAFGKKATYMSEEELGKLLKDENLLDSFIVGTITSGITQSGIVPGMKRGSLIEANKQGADFITGHTETEQKVIDKVTESSVTEREKELGRKLNAKERAEIEEDVETKLIKGGISIDTIEETLGGDSYKAYKEATEKQEALKKELNELRNMKKGEMTDIQTDRLTELKAMDLEDTSKVDELKAKASQDVFELIKADRKGQGSILAESYNERERRGVAFEVDTNKVDSKKADTYKRAMESGVLNNTNATHDFVDLVATLEAEKGVKIDFSNNVKLKTSGFAVDGAEVNGVKTNDGIILNANSRKNLNVVVGHEITHILEGTELYTALRDTIISYAKSKGDYDARYKATSKLYEKVKDTDIDGEITADLVGEYLFTDEKFIKNLTTNKNLFKKVYDEIKYLVNVATAGSAEKKQLLKVQRAFEKAFETSKTEEKATKNTTKNSGAKYSLEDKADNTGSQGNEPKITADMTEEERYEALKKRSINNIPLSTELSLDVIEKIPEISSWDELNKYFGKDKRNLIQKLAKEFGVFNKEYFNEDIELSFEFSGNNFRESYNKQRHNYIEFAKMFSVFDSVIESAVGIEIHNRTDYKLDPTLDNVFVLMSAYQDGEYIVPVKLEVKKFKDKQNTLYVAISLEKIKMTEVLKQGNTGNGVTQNSRSVNISIAQIFAKINHSDKNFLKYIPDGFLDSKQKAAKQEALSDNNDIRYSLSEIVAEDGTSYGIGVKLDSTLLDNLEPKDRISLIKEYVRELQGKVFTAFDEDGEPVDISIAEGNKRFRNSNGNRVATNKDLTTKHISKETKQEAIALIDELVSTASYQGSEAARHPHDWLDNDGNNEWDKWTTYIQDKNNTIWEATLHIANTTNGEKILYDISLIKKAEQSGKSDTSLLTLGQSGESDTIPDDNSIAPLPGNVKRDAKFSLSDTEDIAPVDNIVDNVDIAPIAKKYSDIEEQIKANEEKLESLMAEYEKISNMVDNGEMSVADFDFMAEDITKEYDDTKRRIDALTYELTEIEKNNVTVTDAIKNYSKKDALTVVERMGVNDLTKVARKKLADDLWEGMNKNTTVEQREAFAREFAKTATDTIVKKSRTENPNYNSAKEQLPYIASGIGRLTFTAEDMAELKYKYDKDLKKFLGRWGYKGGTNADGTPKRRYPMSQFVIDYARETAGMSHLEDMHHAEAMVEINELYEDLSAEVKNRWVNSYEEATKEEIESLKADIERTVLEAFETEGRDARVKKGLEAAYDKIDKQFEADKASLDKAFEKSKENALAMSNERDRSVYIAHLEERYAMRLAELTEQVKREKELAKKESERVRRKDLHNSIIEAIKAEYTKRGLDFDEVLDKGKRKGNFASVDNTPQRFIEKTLGYKEGQILNDLTVNKIALNESAGIKWLNGQVDNIRKLSEKYNIKPGSKESAAAQMYGEGFYVNKEGEYVKYGDAELAKDFPSIEVQNNIKALAQNSEVRRMYDETLDAINASRVRNGYPEIPKRADYFLHFRAMDDTFSRLGIPFNPNDIKAKDLPTDINGMTANLKPGQPYFASANKRMGIRTTYDLLGGIERYMNSAKNQIYHIDDIQTLRAVRNYVADRYGQANGLNDLDSMTPDEQEARIKDVYDGHLSTFAKFLNEEANIIAGKTSLMDRSVEGIFGRRAMQVLNTINSQVGKNMVGFNIGSAGTNFLPLVQAAAKLRKSDMIKAFSQTISNKFNSDGFVENDPVLIRRKGADKFAKTAWEKASDIGYVLMSAVDNLTSEVIVRAKYNELTRNGLDNEQAHIKAGEWASRLMGDRSLGQMPQLFNSKTLGIFTKFQLEVRNQLDSMFYDSFQEAKESTENIQDAKERIAKTASKVASTLAQLFVFQHIFGMVYEQIAGYNPTFDILSTLATLFGWDDDEESEDTFGDNLQQAFNELLDDLPYSSLFTGGGRIPISAALPIGQLLTGEDEWGNEVSQLETLAESVPYLLPTGWGQLKKTIGGLSMFSDEHPIAGSYTDSGNLRFPVEETPLNIAQAAVFGQYANKNAREYFDNEYAPLTPNQVEEFMATGMSYSEYSKKKKAKKIKEAKAKELIYSIVGGEDLYQEYTDALSEIKAGVYVDRKTRVLGYLNSLDIDYVTKLILYKKQFPNDNRFNVALVNNLNERDDISYSEMEAILTELGFQVDEDGNIKW